MHCHSQSLAFFLLFITKVSEEEKSHDSSTVINAFQLIGMSPFLDLSGLFETEVNNTLFSSFTLFQDCSLLTTKVCIVLLCGLTQTVSERQIRFMSNRLATDVMEKIKTILMEMGFYVQKKHTMVRVSFCSLLRAVKMGKPTQTKTHNGESLFLLSS